MNSNPPPRLDDALLRGVSGGVALSRQAAAVGRNIDALDVVQTKDDEPSLSLNYTMVLGTLDDTTDELLGVVPEL